jgi:hypothetical protein
MSNKELFARVKEAMQAAEEAGGPRDLTEYTSLMDDIIEECKKRKAAAFVNEIEQEEGSTDAWDWNNGYHPPIK